MTETVDERPSRLMITNMVLENFKSYAGEQDIGPFHKRFSSVVGPNGSGKSNVIDALLFVFGKKAKQLRLNKVSELIHKSSNFPNLEYARVAVHFQRIYDDEDSADGFEIVPGSEFIVTRIAYKDNTSSYLIDGKSSNFGAVGKLLRQHGIDLDNNRFLILQGEVEQIAMMKPKGDTKHEDGLLEYLEDIIGSNCFVERIEEMFKQLEGMNEQRTEKVNRLKVAEKDRDNLSESKQEAEAFINQEKEIRKRKNILYQVYEKVATDNVVELTTRCGIAEAKLIEEQEKMSESDALLKEKEVIYNATSKAYDSVAKEVDEATKEFGAFERRDVKIQEDLKHNKTQFKKFQASIEKDASKEADNLRDEEGAKQSKEVLSQDLADLDEKKSAEERMVDEIMSGLQEATSGLRVQLEVEQEKLCAAERDVAKFQTEKESILTACALAKSRAANVENDLAKLADKRDSIVSERETNGVRINVAQSELINLEQSIVDLETTFKRCEEDEVKLQGAVRVAISATEEGRAALASNQHGTGVLSAILKATKRDGPLSASGVLGRLGDLGTIPSEYDVAISTACGSLDYIVTKTTEGAQMCMQFLRANNLGRASFIALDKMSEWASRMNRTVTLPAAAPRLFDLIKPLNDLVLPAFYFAIKDTLVAKDLDTATSIAYEGDRAKWRVVTLQGGLIDTSGTMSGGGTSTKRGLMMVEGSVKAASAAKATVELPSVTPADVQQLEARVNDLQKQLRACRATKDASDADIKDKQKKIKGLKTEIAKLQMSLTNSADKEKQVIQRISALESERNLSPEEIKEIKLQETKLIETDERIHSASPNISSYRSSVSRLQRKIMDVGGPKVAQAQQKLDILTKKYDDVSNKLASAEVAEATARSNASKAANAREKAEAELNKFKAKIDELKEEQKVMETDAMRVIEAVEQAKACMLEQEEELKRITAEYNVLKEASAKMKTVELDLKNEVSGLSKKVDAQEGIRKSWQAKLAELRKKHIDDQEQFNAAVSACISEQQPTELESTKETLNVSGESVSTVESLPILSADALSARQTNCEEMANEIEELEDQKAEMEKNVNMSALLEYLKKDAFYRTRAEELRIITEARNLVRADYEDLRRQRLVMFMAGFGIITMKLKEMYQMITLGGDAELELVDSMDPFSEGIVFSVRPPKKSWKNISNLSGGEKTLSSLALVFALHHFKPTALYVMDEIDAALDFKNVSIVANYIKERTKNAQFVIISLRNNMFELADRLVGIYKTNDATKSVTINPRTFAESTAGKLVNKTQRPPLSNTTNASTA